MRLVKAMVPRMTRIVMTTMSSTRVKPESFREKEDIFDLDCFISFAMLPEGQYSGVTGMMFFVGFIIGKNNRIKNIKKCFVGADLCVCPD